MDGTTQETFEEALVEMMTPEVYGNYFCLSELVEQKARQKHHSMRGFVDDGLLTPATLSRVYENRVVAQFFFSAPEDPIIGYSEDVSGGVTFLTDAGRSPDATDNKARVASTQAGILAFTRDYIDAAGRMGITPDPEGLAQPLIDVLSCGVDSEWRYILEVLQDLNGFMLGARLGTCISDAAL